MFPFHILTSLYVFSIAIREQNIPVSNGLFTNYTFLCLLDIDECAAGTNACIYPSVCTNTLGSYVCDCPSGFVDIEGICQGK